MSGWTVWVGGIEVNDTLLTQAQAKAIAHEYIANGYDEVQIEEVK